MTNKWISVLSCTENGGELLFQRLFRNYENAVAALTKEYDALKEALLEDVPAEQITEGYRYDNEASITWIEEGESITYHLGITEEELE